MNYCSERGIPHSVFLTWSEADRAKQLAFLMEEAERCQLCGTAEWEWEQNKFAYTAMERTCKGCQKKALASDAEHTMPGTTIELVPSSPELTARLALLDKRRLEQIRDAKAVRQGGGAGSDS